MQFNLDNNNLVFKLLKALKFNTPKELYIYNVKDIWANKTTLLRSDLTTAFARAPIP